MRRRWPLLLAALAFVLLLATALAALRRLLPDGDFAYALDDAYIHLSMARSLADHGVFGVTRYAFSASSSSPLWVLLLAGFWRGGLTLDVIPLLLNLLAALGLLWALDRLLARALGPLARLAALLAALLVAPLVFLALTGMEHVLHALLSLLFLERAARVIAREAKAGPGLFVLAVLCSAARYEGLFAVGMVGLLLLFGRRWRLALGVVAAGVAAPLAYGLVNLAHGAYFLPNSILAKAQHPEGHGIGALLRFAGLWANALRREPALGWLVLANALLLAARWRGRRRGAAMAFGGLVVGASVLHAQFARLALLYRYEAYLLVLGIAALAWNLSEWLEDAPAFRWRAGVAVAGLALLAWPLGARAWHVQSITARAMVNIFEQQVQVGRFLGSFYRGEVVAANDVGAVTWYGEPRLVDLMGLATRDVIRAKMAGAFDTAYLERLGAERGVRVAVVYDRWFAGMGRPLPANWPRVARWRIPGNVICGDDTVSFYATSPSEAALLAEHLRDFAPALPPGVEVIDG